MGMAAGQFLLFILNVFFWIIIIQVALSWLIAFNVVNISNPSARNFVELLNKVTDPVYKPLRKIIPSLGGIDITPMIVIFGIYLLQSLIGKLFFHMPVYM